MPGASRGLVAAPPAVRMTAEPEEERSKDLGAMEEFPYPPTLHGQEPSKAQGAKRRASAQEKSLEDVPRGTEVKPWEGADEHR